MSAKQWVCGRKLERLENLNTVHCEIPFGGTSDAKNIHFPCQLIVHQKKENSVIINSTKAPQFCSFKLGSAAGMTYFCRPKPGNELAL